MSKKYIDRLGPTTLAIFLFHGVVEQNDHRIRNYNKKHLLSSDFRDLMQALKKAGTPVSMTEVMEHCESGDPLPADSFAITFDDGFENNFSVAAPILEDCGVPATFYVTTRFIDENGMSWIDQVEALFEDQENFEVRLPWRAAPAVVSGQKQAIELLEEIRFNVKRSAHISQSELVSDIYGQFNRTPIEKSDDPLDLKMTWQQVAEIAGNPLFEIGGHSHTHPILSFLSSDQLAEELDYSLKLLQEKAKLKTAHYSYPEGLEHCYTPEIIKALQSRGIRCCPTAEDGVNTGQESPFLLKRIAVV